MLTTLVATAVISNARSNPNFDSLEVAVYVDQLIRSRCVSIHGEVCTCESVCAVDDFLSQNMPFTRHNPFDDLVSMRRLYMLSMMSLSTLLIWALVLRIAASIQ